MSFSQLEKFPKPQAHPTKIKMTFLPQDDYLFYDTTMQGNQDATQRMNDIAWTHIEPLQAWYNYNEEYQWAPTMDVNAGRNHNAHNSYRDTSQIRWKDSTNCLMRCSQNQTDPRQLQNPTRSSYSNENLPNNYQSENESYYQYYHSSGYSDTQRYHHKTKHHHTASLDKDPFSNVKGNSTNQRQQTNRSTKTYKTTQNILLTKQNCPSDGALQPLDIVCGRGAPTDYHYENQVFRDIVEDHYTKYLCAKRSDKAQIAMKIMDIVKSKGGKFVRRQKSAGRFIWEPIGDKAAYEKVCQALRDGNPQLHRQMLSTACIKEHKAPSPVPSCISESR